MLSKDTPHKDARVNLVLLLSSTSKADLWKAFTFLLSGRIPYTSRNTHDKTHTFYCMQSLLEDQKIVLQWLRTFAVIQINDLIFSLRIVSKQRLSWHYPYQSILTRKGSCIHLPNFYWRAHGFHFYTHFIPHRLQFLAVATPRCIKLRSKYIWFKKIKRKKWREKKQIRKADSTINPQIH